MRTATAVLAVLALAAPAALASNKGESKPKRPRLDLRISPRMAFSPATVLVTAELVGGDDSEEFSCPEIEWEWDDGGKSVAEADCEPWQPGKAMERRFTAEHLYKRAGIYNIKLTLRKANRSLAVAQTKLTVRAGLGDPTFDGS